MKTNRTVIAGGLLAVTLIICSVVFVSATGWARLIWNTAGYLSLTTCFIIARLKLEDIGLAKKHLKSGLLYGGAAAAVLAVLFTLIFLIDKSIFQDPRYNNAISTSIFVAFVLLPLKTVLFEELAFRGILPAIVLNVGKNQRFAALLSSLAFGLWHISSAFSINGYKIGNTDVSSFIVVSAVVIATSLAGLAFYELRRRSNNLAAPIIAHWFLNASAIMLAALSWS